MSDFDKNTVIYIVLILQFVIVLVSSDNNESNGSNPSTDEYLKTNQKECFSSRKLVSCIKYKVARSLWSMATNRFDFAFREGSKSLKGNESLQVQFIQLSEPSSLTIFPEARHKTDDNELIKAWHFLKRATQEFLQRHGFMFSLSNNFGTRVYEPREFDIESRGDKKKKKWLIILPLIILMKIAHLKMTLVPITLGIGAIQLLLVAGGSYLFYYLKHNTLCRIQPHLIQSHSHVWDTDSDYSTFGGGAHFSPSSSYHSGLGGGGGGGYSRDWGANRAYNAYNYHAENVGKEK